ncbi:MAG: hypothetical protein HGA85_06740, partial [Nanoarchaeota archaeon]|nr:hypothetical protein [Nanoarchaeota archaeon]
MIFSSSHEIAGKLKYFSFNPSGKPVLKLDLKVCDFHTHLGFSYLFTQNINLLKGSMNVRYELPADIPIDLDKYS